MRLRSVSIGMVLLTAGTVIGVSSQQFAAADVSSGDRPIFVQIDPCRLVDTRNNGLGGPRSTPFGPGEIDSFDVAGDGTDCAGRLPSDAVAISTNLTALNATSTTFMTVWASGDRPIVSNLNPSPGTPPAPNAANIDLTDAGTFSVYNDAGSVDMIIDVNGFYVPHDHDDRYYTEAEADARFAAQNPIATDIEPHLFDYLLDGDWDADTGWESSGSSRDCLYVGLDIPEGTAIDSVEVSYRADAVVEAEIGVFSVRRTAGPSGLDQIQVHHANNIELDQTDPDTVETAIVEHDDADLGSAPAQVPVAGDDYDTGAQFCTEDAVVFVSMRVNFA